MQTPLSFTEFLTERALVQRRRLLGLPRPWTQDFILHSSRFTNLNRQYDRGTVRLVRKVAPLPMPEKVFVTVLYRSGYSSPALLDVLTGNVGSDLQLLSSQRLVLSGRRPYQVFLHRRQSMQEFLLTTANAVANHLIAKLPSLQSSTIQELADDVADLFASLHGKRLIFLATEIVKDLAIFYPDAVNPTSMCPMNVGARRGLHYVDNQRDSELVARLAQHTRMEISTLENSLCEYGKYRIRWSYYQTNGALLPGWMFEVASNPLLQMREAIAG